MSQHGFPERLSGKSKPLDEDVVCQGQGTMEILVESLTGSAFQMTVSPSDTIHAIKLKIFRVEGIPMSHQHLLYNLKELEDSCSLSDYNIKDGCTLKLVLSIRGGPISTRRLPLQATVEDLQWRDIKELVENNRDEAIDWLPPGCKVLVVKDGDNVNLLKVIEDDNDERYTNLSDYSFSDETAVTMCKMIDLRSKMEKLSMKRNKKKHSRSKLWMNRVDNASTSVIKRTTSEENISCTMKGVFDETPNFTKYKYGKMASSKGNNDENTSNYCSIFQVEPQAAGTSSSTSTSSRNDKFGLWHPLDSLTEITGHDSKSWQQACSSRGFLSRDSSTSDFFKAKSDCSSSTESFKDSILAGAFGNSSGKHSTQDVDAFGDGNSSDQSFLREDGDLLASDVAQPGPKSCNPSAGGSGPGGVVLETTTAPTPALPLPLLAHSPNAGCNYGDYRVAQLLGNDAVASTSAQYDNHNQYHYGGAGPATTQLKRIVRKMMFRSNSHLNTTPEPVPGPSYTLGSESHLDQLDDLKEERIAPGYISSSITDLFLDTKLTVPRVDRTWSSELDKAESVKYKRTSTVRPGNMVFSSSTSDLLGLKRHKILPSLSRHPNCERLDVSNDSLLNIDLLKNDSSPFKSSETKVSNAPPVDNTSKKNSARETPSTSSMVSWPNPNYSTKTYTTPPLDSRPRHFHSFHDKPSRISSIHNIRYVQNGNSSDELNNASSVPYQYGAPGSSRRNLEVGSERRCRRIKKILKLDHNNLQDKNNIEVMSRRNFLLGYSGQGYEASIQKMPNSNCQVSSSERSGEHAFSKEDSYTPLYERCLTVYSNRKHIFSPSEKIDNSTSKLLNGLKHLNTSVENIEDKKSSEPVVLQPTDTDDNSQQLKKPKRIRCAFCKKRLSIASIHTCRCGVIFCAPHRYAEVHGCQYDYKAEGQEYLRRANPLVSAPKLPKI